MSTGYTTGFMALLRKRRQTLPSTCYSHQLLLSACRHDRDPSDLESNDASISSAFMVHLPLAGWEVEPCARSSESSTPRPVACLQPPCFAGVSSECLGLDGRGSLRPNMWRRVVPALCFVALALGYCVFVLRVFGEATVDDAGITYAYAHNLAQGAGLRLTPLRPPIEGFSNFLQVLLLSVCDLAGTDLDSAAKWLNVGAVAIALCVLGVFLWQALQGGQRVVAILPLLLVMGWPSFNYWISGGLEGGLLAGLQVASLMLLLSSDRSSLAGLLLGVASGLLAWCRPDALLYGAIAVGVGVLWAPRCWRAVMVFSLLVAALVITRLLVFDDFVPNTIWAKMGSDRGLSDGVRYVGSFFSQRWHYFVALFPLAAWGWRRGRATAVAALLQCLCAIGFAALTGGDWMSEWRYLQPFFAPWLVLSVLGCMALASAANRFVRLAQISTVAFVALFLAGQAMTPGWWVLSHQIGAHRDAPLDVVDEAARGYRALFDRLRFDRPPLVAEVDIGGLSFRSNLEVLDLVGLADRTMAFAWFRTSGPATDYLYQEQRPDTIHLHGAWFSRTPVDRIASFDRDYRKLRGQSLESVRPGLLGVRADALDPLTPSAHRFHGRLGPVELSGVTAIERPDGYVLFLHGRLIAEREPAAVEWISAKGIVGSGTWHAGEDVEPGPAGSAVLAQATVPKDTELPLRLAGTSLEVDRWPFAADTPSFVGDLLQAPLRRLAGGQPTPCSFDDWLDRGASAVARARGIGFLAELCPPLPEGEAQTHAEQMLVAARAATDPGDRYEAARAILRLNIPQSGALRSFLRHARSARSPYNEVLVAFADRYARASPHKALRFLFLNRQFEEVIRYGLSHNVSDTSQHPVLCAAAQNLGLRTDRLHESIDCATQFSMPLIFVDSFEEEADPLLDLEEGQRVAGRVSRRQGSQGRVVGAHGNWFLNTFDADLGDETTGEIVWGPTPWRGRYFGALLGGGITSATEIVVEGRTAEGWTELARLRPSQRSEALRPVTVDLGELRATEVRVRIRDQARGGSGHLLVDALTFVEF